MEFEPLVALGLGASALVATLGPVALALWAWRRLGASGLAWLTGAGTFFVAQMLLRIPWVVPLQQALGPRLKASPALLWGFIGFLSLTAGLWEEWGRFLAYRLVWKDRSAKNAVMMGLGHGGFESILLVGLSLAVSTALYVALTHEVKVPLPGEAADALRAQFEAITPGLSIAGGVERISAWGVHVGCSMLVLQAFVRGSKRWVWASVAFHAATNFAGVGLAKVHVWVSEGAIAVFAAAAVWWTVRLYRKSPPPAG